MTSREPIVIVGAGPVGLTLALALVESDIPVVVLEAASSLSTEWRASTFHPPTLELLAPLGVTFDMLVGGLVAHRYQHRDMELPEIAEFDLSVLHRDTPYPYRLQYEQYKLTAALESRLLRSGLAEIRFDHRVVAVDQDGSEAVAEVASPTGSSQIRAPYVIGADGANSSVRKSLEVPFEGDTYPHEYVLISTDFPFDRAIPGLSHVNYISGPDDHYLVLRIPDVWRVLFSVEAGAEPGPPVTDARIRGCLDAVAAGAGDAPVLNVQQYRIHQRVADRFREGRIVLIGDAAHVNSPFGGLGLNSGIHDVFDLAPRLARAYADDEADEALDAYSDRRRDVALRYVRQVSDRNTRMVSERDRETRAANIARLAALADDPRLAREHLLETTMLNAVREQQLGLPEPTRLVEPTS
jgi:3-(3-hydroxy-phenyl)propionate hydroxylase